jgi:hypothetical protein
LLGTGTTIKGGEIKLIYVTKYDLSMEWRKAVNRRTDSSRIKRKRTKEQITIYKTLHRKLRIEQHEAHLKPGMNSGAPEG